MHGFERFMHEVGKAENADAFNQPKGPGLIALSKEFFTKTADATARHVKGLAAPQPKPALA